MDLPVRPSTSAGVSADGASAESSTGYVMTVDQIGGYHTTEGLKTQPDDELSASPIDREQTRPNGSGPVQSLQSSPSSDCRRSRLAAPVRRVRVSLACRGCPGLGGNSLNHSFAPWMKGQHRESHPLPPRCQRPARGSSGRCRLRLQWLRRCQYQCQETFHDKRTGLVSFVLVLASR